MTDDYRRMFERSAILAGASPLMEAEKKAEAVEMDLLRQRLVEEKPLDSLEDADRTNLVDARKLFGRKPAEGPQGGDGRHGTWGGHPRGR